MTEEEVKKFIFYGKDGKSDKHLDYAILTMFDLLSERTIFDRKLVEKTFWERIKELSETTKQTKS